MDIMKANADRLADYIGFLIAFSKSPAETISRQVDAAEDQPPAVGRKLLLYAALSVGLAYVIVEIGAGIGMADDPSHLIRVASNLDRLVLPVATLFVLVAGGILIHLAFIVVGLIGVLAGHERFRGSVFHSVNASLGFAAWAIPLLTIVIVGLRIAAANDYEPGPLAIFVIAVPPALAFWIYFIAAIAGAHRIPRGQAASLFALTVVLAALAGDLLD